MSALLAALLAGPAGAQDFKFARQENYGPHFEAINARLRALGLRTYTPEEIRGQIAQAEIDAYFRNDPDAAPSASRRLAARLVLRGLIGSEATRNPVMTVNQMAVSMKFTLYGSDGRLISRWSPRLAAPSTDVLVPTGRENA